MKILNMRYFLILFLLAIVGCARVVHHITGVHGYDGPERPISELAVLRARYDGMTETGIVHRGVAIAKIDSKKVNEVNLFSGNIVPDEVFILPGKRAVKLEVVDPYGHGYPVLEFIAEAGHSYSPRLRTDTKSYNVWIVDDATGSVVSKMRK